jgi:IclR family transcriptional regulator, acetate operon repressor
VATDRALKNRGARAIPGSRAVAAGAAPSDAKGSRRSTVQSVARAFDVLEVLKRATAPMSALEVAGATGLDRTVVHRLLRTIGEYGLVVEEHGVFRLGPASVLIANRYVDNLLVRRLALPYLLDLQSRVLGERPWNVSLSIPVGDVSTVVERLWTPGIPLDAVLDVGDTHPIDRGAAGRSILAYYEESDALEAIGPERYAEVAPVLERVRAAGGVALSEGEASPGTYAVAAVIRSRRSQPVAAIGVAGLDLGDELAYDSSLAGHLRRAAEAVGHSIP